MGSQSTDLVIKSQQRLQKTLESELKYEEENYQYDHTVDDSLEQNGFKLKEQENNQTMELVKQNGDINVRIIFQSRAPSNFNDQQDEEQQNEQNQQDEEQQQEDEQDFCDFQVVLTRKGQSIVYECTSVEGEIQVAYVINLGNNVEEFLAKDKGARYYGQYNGPEFDTLDEKLQNDLMEYLRAQGINEEVAAIVEHLSLDKEQRLYQNWIKSVHSFLA